MAKKLNKNLVVGLAALGFAITTVAGVVLVKTFQQSDPLELASKADQYAKSTKAEDWQRAMQFYGRAFGVSNQAIYKVRAADMMRRLGKEINALQTYRDAVVIEPELLEAQEKVLDLLLEFSEVSPNSTDNWMEVQKTADAILAIDGQAEHVRAMYGRGAALLGLRALAPDNEVKGVETLQKAAELDPGAVDVVKSLSVYYMQNEQPAAAEKVILNLVEHNQTPGKEAAEARCLLAEFQQEEGTFESAIETLDEALKMTGDDDETRAVVLVRIGRMWTKRWTEQKRSLENDDPSDDTADAELAASLERANEAADQAIAADPEGFDGYMLRSALHRQKGELPEAIEVLKQRLSRPFQREGLQSGLNRLRRYTLLLTLADLCVVRITETEPGAAERDELIAQATMYIDDAQGEQPTGPEVAMARGKLHFILGENAQAVKWLEQAEQYSRGLNPSVMYFLALARLQIGQVGGAHEAIVQAVSSPNASAPVWATYARILLQLDQPQEALSAANQALARNPGNQDALMLKAGALEKLGRAKEVEAILGSMSTTSGAMTATRAQVVYRMGRKAEAVQSLETAVASDPANVRLVNALAGMYRDLDRAADARKVIAEARAKDPNNFELKLLALNHSELSADERLAKYQELVNELDDEYQRALRLAGIYEQENDWENRYEQFAVAFKLIQGQKTAAAREAGENAARGLIDVMFQIAAEHQQSERLDQLVEWAANWNDGLGLDAAEGQSYRGRRLTVDAYWATQRAAEAARAGDKAQAEAEAAEARKIYNRAIEALELALERFPSNGQSYAQLGEAYLRIGRFNDSRAALEKAAGMLPRNGMVAKMLAQLSQQMNDEQAFNDWLDRAKQLIPDDSWVAEQLVVRQEESNPREGIVRREQLRTENPQDLRNLLKLAQLYHQIGDRDRAEQRLDEVLAADSTYALAPAVAHVFRMIDRPKRALKLLEDNLRAASPEDKATAQLLIGYHYDALQDPAADAAFLAAADFNANETVCLEIGRHFFTRGRFDLADEWLQKAEALAAQTGSLLRSEIQQLRITTLVRLDDLDRAAQLVAAFAERFPDDPIGAFLNAQVLNAQGDTLAALRELEGFIEKRGQAGMSGHQYELALFRHAQYCYNLGRWQDCVKDLEELAATNSTAFRFTPRILLSRVYRKIGRKDAAIQELERVYKNHPEAAPAVEALIDAYLMDERYDDANAVLAAMRNRDPGNANWLVRSGDVAHAREERDVALNRYQEAAVASGYNPAVCAKLLETCVEYKAFGAIEPGIRFYEDSIPPDRRTPRVMLPYARLLALRGDIDSAVEMFRLALYRGGFGSFEFVMELVSSVKQALGGQALTVLEQRPPEEMFARVNNHIVALLQYGMGKHEDALATAQALLADSSDPQEKATIYFLIGRIYESMAEWSKCKESYEQALAVDSRNLAALNDLAYLLTDKLNQPAEAVPYARRAVQVSTGATLLDTLDTLGWAYLNLGGEHVKEAIGQFTRARELDPDYPPINYHLAEALRRNRQFDAAAQLFTEVVNLPAGGAHDEYREKARRGLQQANDGVAD